MLTVTIMLWEIDPLVPITVTVYGPGAAEPELTVRIEVPDPPAARTMLAELNDAVGPEGETDTTRLTFPVKPLWLFKATVETPDEPDWIVRMVGLELIMKSPTMTVTLTVCDRPPGPVPVRMTV